MNSKGKEMPHGVRLYSIASTRYGDAFDGQTASLCVRRATFWDSEKNAEDPAKKGLCSNFLCDAKPGDEVTMTGESAHACWCLLYLHWQPNLSISQSACGQRLSQAPLRLLNLDSINCPSSTIIG